MEYGKQDARAAELNLETYDEDDMFDDLGNHRREALPLSGKQVRVSANIAPDIRKYGSKTLREIKKNEGVVSAWGALYDPSLDENRRDGLGTGQAHRLGGNFRPCMEVLGGKGHPCRARSLSPARRGGDGGRGRGNVKPGTSLGDRMETRPNGAPAPTVFTSIHKTSNDPSMRHVRRKVNTRAKDDMVALRNPATNGMGDAKVGHWWGGRLCVNKDSNDFFHQGSGGKPGGGLEASRYAPASHSPQGFIVPAGPTAAVVAPNVSWLATGGLEASKYAPATTVVAPILPKPAAHAPRISKSAGGHEAPMYARVDPKAAAFVPNKPANGLEASRHAPTATVAPTTPKTVASAPGVTKPATGPGTFNYTVNIDTLEKHALSNIRNKNLPRVPSIAKPASPPTVGAPPAPPSPSSTIMPTVEGNDPEIIEELRTKIESLEEEVGSATVLLSIYQDELKNVRKDEKHLLAKLQDIQQAKSKKQMCLDRQQEPMDDKKSQLSFLKLRLAKLEAEATLENAKQEAIAFDLAKKKEEEEERVRRQLERLDKERLEQALQRKQRVEAERLEKEHPFRHANGVVNIKAPNVYPQCDAKRDSAKFAELNALPDEKVLERICSFPFRVKIVMRPIVDQDPLIVDVNPIDQPNQKIRRGLMAALTQEEFKYFTRLEAYNTYVDALSHIFYKHMALVLGNNQ